ncbi:MAG: hypothetical protein EPO58_15870 [Chitinophagaceae bacterium]|nr:MAG: hypothetical protein EPO58_15870 [Chitinophagaceae bacterium]
MKRLTTLLPIYFLILACMPCVDTDGSNMITGQASITSSHSQDQDHDNNNETCPPFCSCNCCGQRAPAQRVVYTSSPIETLTIVKQAALQSFSLQNVLQQIWQPPQLV